MLHFGKKKRCLSDSQLIDYVLDQILSAPIDRETDSHLSTCNSCRIRLAELLTSLNEEQRSAFIRNSEVRQGFHRIAAAGDTRMEVVAYWAAVEGDVVLRLEKGSSKRYFLSIISEKELNDTQWILQYGSKTMSLDLVPLVRLWEDYKTLMEEERVIITDGNETHILERQTP